MVITWQIRFIEKVFLLISKTDLMQPVIGQ